MPQPVIDDSGAVSVLPGVGETAAWAHPWGPGGGDDTAPDSNDDLGYNRAY